jgi:primary-amine oxidase
MQKFSKKIGFSINAYLRPIKQLAIAGLLLCVSAPAMSQSCPGNQLIDVTFSEGSRFDMCWELRDEEGIVLKKINFKPSSSGARRSVLYQLNLAEIYVAFDDGSPSAFNVTDLAAGGGLGVSSNIHTLTAADCPSGVLMSTSGNAVLCRQVVPRGYAYKSYAAVKQGEALVVHFRTTVGFNTYIVRWRFFDDGTIEPSVGLSGEVPALTNLDKYGWALDSSGRIGVGFNTSYYWRIDFDIGSVSSDDVVEQIEILPSANRTKKTISMTTLSSESSRSINEDVKRSWRVRDGSIKNSDGHYISYHLDALHTAHRFEGTVDTPWAEHDFHVTRYKSCERFIQSNPTTGGCGSDISDFVNGQSISPADIVLWYRLNYHHLPRSEDEPSLPAHWDGFTIVPRDWTSTNPISKVLPKPALFNPLGESIEYASV